MGKLNLKGPNCPFECGFSVDDPLNEDDVAWEHWCPIAQQGVRRNTIGLNWYFLNTCHNMTPEEVAQILEAAKGYVATYITYSWDFQWH